MFLVYAGGAMHTGRRARGGSGVGDWMIGVRMGCNLLADSGVFKG
ncbi:hypothetical protein [Parendozoicomonas sp. Alg238-R29]|nr:hypothetical protein [Parendozoicomonas sp. Alg238-R29]